MCLVGFASLQSPWAHTLKASLPCLLLPLHRPSPFLQPLQKNTYHLSCLYLPLHQPLHPHNLLKSTSIASPRTTTLAPLAEGEVLSPEKIRATTGGIAFLPHPFRFSDTSVNNPSVTVMETRFTAESKDASQQSHNYSLFIIHHSLYKKSAVFSDNGH